MNSRAAVCVAGAIGLVGALVAMTPRVEGVGVAAETLNIDPVHSSMVFRVKHVNATNFYGRFNKIGGQIVWDDANPSASSVSVEIDASSVDTANEGRNKHLRSPDFFNADQYPKATFKSTSIAGSGPVFDVSGDFTLAGVTKPITVKFEKTGTGDMRGQTVHGFETTFTINRQDYGVKYGAGALGDEVRITVSLEAGAGGGRPSR